MDDEKKLILTDEKGIEYEFQVVDVLEVDEKAYTVLLPLDSFEGEAIVLKVDQDENGDEILFEIEDEEEWNMVSRVWEQLNNPQGKNGESRKKSEI